MNINLQIHETHFGPSVIAEVHFDVIGGITQAVTVARCKKLFVHEVAKLPNRTVRLLYL